MTGGTVATSRPEIEEATVRNTLIVARMKPEDAEDAESARRARRFSDGRP
jgi:hypothetical protein